MAEILNIPGLRGWDTAMEQARARNAAESQELGQQLGLAGQVMTLQEAFRKRQEDEETRELFRSSGGDLTKMRDSAYAKGFYKVGTELDKHLREQKKQDLDNLYKLGQIDEQQRKRIESANDALASVFEHPVTITESLIRKGVPRDMAIQQGQAAYERVLPAARQNPLLANVQLPERFDPDFGLAQLATTKRTKDLFGRLHQEATLEESKRAAGEREATAKGHLAVAQSNLGLSGSRLQLERERFERENDPAKNATPIVVSVNGRNVQAWKNKGKIYDQSGTEIRNYAPQITAADQRAEQERAGAQQASVLLARQLDRMDALVDESPATIAGPLSPTLNVGRYIGSAATGGMISRPGREFAQLVEVSLNEAEKAGKLSNQQKDELRSIFSTGFAGDPDSVRKGIQLFRDYTGIRKATSSVPSARGRSGQIGGGTPPPPGFKVD